MPSFQNQIVDIKYLTKLYLSKKQKYEQIDQNIQQNILTGISHTGNYSSSWQEYSIINKYLSDRTKSKIIIFISAYTQRSGLVTKLKISIPYCTYYLIYNRFASTFQQISYQYPSRQFLLTRTIQGADVQYRVGSLFIERFDHPFFRQTLYFDQLKDADEYVQIGVPKSFPKEIQDQFRKSTVSQLLDQKNPLGIPLQSKPTQINIMMNKDSVRSEFNLKCRLGKTKLSKIYHYPNIDNPTHQKMYNIDKNKLPEQQLQKFLINPFLLDNNMQQIIFDLLANKAHITVEEIAQMSKLAYIGGCVDRIQIMMGLFNQISAFHIKKF